ncbi:MAG: PEPxxWA-CTERM sorting domain-containing protein [Alphaproteobacteria bacterium]|nr:PEPxxWA-CTERM sorting domain-containing protein [Alphaproteobacteria bacterium]
MTNLIFGRSASGTDVSLPQLVTDVTLRPDFPAILAFPFSPQAQRTFILGFRQGTATTTAGLNALPFQQLQMGSISYSVQAVPESASWALLIAGFGLVGAAARARRLRPA